MLHRLTVQSFERNSGVSASKQVANRDMKRGMTASPSEQWHCPYCDKSGQTLREIQTHITDSTEGDHEGISGETPDQDIIATNENGDQVDVYEKSEVVRPQDATLQNVSQRKQVTAAWVVSDDNDIDVDTLAAITDADREYARQILGQIDRGEINREYRADLDEQLKNVMRKRIAKHQTNSNRENTDNMATSQPQENMENISSVNAKTIILNTYDLLGDDLTRKPAWKALKEAGIIDTGYEYFRRTYKEAIDGEISQADISEAVDEQIQSTIESVLARNDVIETASDIDDATANTDSTNEEAVDTTGARSKIASESNDPSASRQVSTVKGGVAVEDLRVIRDRLELLREQAAFEGGAVCTRYCKGRIYWIKSG